MDNDITYVLSYLGLRVNTKSVGFIVCNAGPRRDLLSDLAWGLQYDSEIVETVSRLLP